jgi:methylenetetrahydrofolate dehydrogenase (NADP+) / methenyltetrahydrofolate cyclohydrolase
MIVDGKQIARQIEAELKTAVEAMDRAPLLTVFTCAPNFETKKFLRLKASAAKRAGIDLHVHEFAPDATMAEVEAAILDAHATSEGIIVQLPFPAPFDTKTLLETIAPSHDVDVLRYAGEETTILPPVVGAIDAIANYHHVVWEGKRVVVVGTGRLVGLPATHYARTQGATVSVVTKETLNPALLTTEADILILGAGVPGLITQDMVKDRVVVFDAGTSEEAGILVGDADAAVAERAELFTPVPGGIGPITIAILLRNLLQLAVK